MKYYDATICENGHVISSYRSNESKFCPQCGTKTFSVCQKCNSTIQGSCYNDEFVIYEEYQKPYYYSNCGHPFPWTQKILDNAVELLSFDNEIDEFSKELIKTAIPGLIVYSQVETPLSIARYKKGICCAGQMIKDSMRQLLIDVVCEVAKKSLFD